MFRLRSFVLPSPQVALQSPQSDHSHTAQFTGQHPQSSSFVCSVSVSVALGQFPVILRERVTVALPQDTPESEQSLQSDHGVKVQVVQFSHVSFSSCSSVAEQFFP